MPPFRRVEARHAGNDALGILVPQGSRTVVILRPRSLPWDLLPVRWDGQAESRPDFCQFSRDEAAAVARRLPQELETSVARRVNPVETLGDPCGSTIQVWVRTEEFFLIVCHRAPGQSYEPVTFATRDEARSAGELLVPLVWPGDDANQEYYFNTQQFSG